MEAKNLEFNTASTALGSTPIRNLFRHILPNSLAPIIVVGTTSLATYIVLEATLSFLGVGLPTTTVKMCIRDRTTSHAIWRSGAKSDTSVVG